MVIQGEENRSHGTYPPPEAGSLEHIYLLTISEKATGYNGHSRRGNNQSHGTYPPPEVGFLEKINHVARIKPVKSFSRVIYLHV